MPRKHSGRIFLSVILIIISFGSAGVDFNTSHIFNPTWPPHARYHDVMLLILLIGAACISIWLLWRRSKEPFVGLLVATLIIMIFAASFFLAWLVPGASPSLAPDGSTPLFAGIPILPNIVAAFLVLILTPFAYRLCCKQLAEEAKNV